LAPLVRQEIWAAIRQLRREGMAMLIVDKNLREVASAAEGMVVIEMGRVPWRGTSDQLCLDTELQQRYLGV